MGLGHKYKANKYTYINTIEGDVCSSKLSFGQEVLIKIGMKNILQRNRTPEIMQSQMILCKCFLGTSFLNISRTKSRGNY